MAAPTLMPEYLQISCKEVAVSHTLLVKASPQTHGPPPVVMEGKRCLREITEKKKKKRFMASFQEIRKRLDKHGNTWQDGGPARSADVVRTPPAFPRHSSGRAEGFSL